MNRKSRGLIIALLVIALIPAGVLAAAKKHPQVPLEQDCIECHEAPARTWEAGKHGQVGVQCVICHGDLGKSFASRPAADRCSGCHAEQVAGTAERHKGKEKNCWVCHEGHSLKLKFNK